MGGRRGRRRWPWVVLFTSIALVAIFYGAGAWYFAGQVYDDALQAQPYDPAGLQGGTVRAYDPTGELITLVPDGEDREETKYDEGVVGLVIGESLVVAGPAVRGEGGEQTRPVISLGGGTPAIGDRYGLTRDVWLNPAQAGLEAQDVVIETLDHRGFPAWLIPGAADPNAEAPAGGGRWAILTHGKGAARSEMLRLAGPLHRAGFTVLVITHTGDIGAPAYQDGMVHYGRTEWEEVEAAVEYADSQGAETIVLGGASHGGAVTLGFLAHGSQTGKVDGVILDAPASDFGDVIDEAAEFRSLPVIQRPIPESLEGAAKWLVAFRYGVDFAAVDYTDMADLVQVPLLIFQGDADRTVPKAVNDRFTGQGGAGAAATYLVVDDADHLMSWNIDPEGYEKAVTEFVAGLTPDGEPGS